MKISDIIKEGVLSSLVKGMAKGAGLSRVGTDNEQQTQIAPSRRPTATTTVSPKRTTGKNDMQVVVDKPGQPLTIRYGGQLYSTEGGRGSNWIMTKTGREVNKHFQQVLDTEWERYVGGND